MRRRRKDELLNEKITGERKREEPPHISA